MVEQHPLTIVTDRDRGQRGRHAQDMLYRAEVDPVPFQLVEGESAVSVLTQAANQRRLDAKLGCCHRRVAGDAAQHRVEVIGDVLAGSPRHLAVAEDEVDDGDADAQDPCHCLPELVAATVAGVWGAVQVGAAGPSRRPVARRHQHDAIAIVTRLRGCAVATGLGQLANHDWLR